MKFGEILRGGAFACLAVAAVFGLGVGSAQAAGFVATGSSVLDGSTTVTFGADPGKQNDVTFTRISSRSVRVTDTGDGLAPIAPCVQVSPGVADCPIDPAKPWIVSATLGDLGDTVAFGPVPDGLLEVGEGSIDFSFLSGDSGADSIEGGPGQDQIDGGPGDDQISGRSGRDVLNGGEDDDLVVANDSRVDAQIDCGNGVDVLNRDNVDPAGVGCETVTTTNADIDRTFEQRMPDVRTGIFAPMAAQEIVDTLGLLFPARLDPDPLSYEQARALAGQEPVPFAVLRQHPPAGVGVRVSLGSPQKVRLSYWDPSDDALRQRCDPSARVSSRSRPSKGLRLDKALLGLEFREGARGNEGEAQELLRRFGCAFETKLVYSRSLDTSSRVIGAAFRRVVTRKRVNGRLRLTRSWKLVVTAKVAKSGNDFILFFSDNPDAPAAQLPLSAQSRVAKRENSSFRLFLREAATGRAAPGVTVELKDGDARSSLIASGKTDAEGEVNLQFRAAGPGDLKLYAFRQARDPASGELITQDSTVEIVSTTAGRTWTSLGGRTFVEKQGGGYRRTSGAGPSATGPASRGAQASATGPYQFIFEVSQAMSALSLAQIQGTALGLSVNQTSELALVYASMLGLGTGNPAVSALLGATRLEPTLGVGSAGKICESNGSPPMLGVLMPGFSGPEIKAGGGVLARFDCGRSLLVSRSGLAVLPKGWVSGSAPLIANDGASLIANDGASLIANDGASLLANDAATLLANDGASLLPVSKLMSNHGGGIVSNNSGALIANDGASFNPLGPGTSLMPSTGR
jgi:hypothetical protein